MTQRNAVSTTQLVSSKPNFLLEQSLLAPTLIFEQRSVHMHIIQNNYKKLAFPPKNIKHSLYKTEPGRKKSARAHAHHRITSSLHPIQSRSPHQVVPQTRPSGTDGHNAADLSPQRWCVRRNKVRTPLAVPG